PGLSKNVRKSHGPCGPPARMKGLRLTVGWSPVENRSPKRNGRLINGGAESVLVKQQLLILNRPRKRSPNLRVADRVVAGLCALLMRPGRLICSAIVLKPSTLLGLHRALKNRKYRLLFSPKARNRPGPKGPSYKVIAAVVQM